MHKKLNLIPRAAGACALVSLCLFARPAHAGGGSRLALDLDYSHGIDEPGLGSGSGLGLRYGYKVDLLVLAITPELGLNYASYSGAAGVKYYRGFAGGRLSFGKVLEPGIFAHIGYGHISFDPDGGRSAPTVDGGITLDLTVIPVIDLGAHFAYCALLAKDGSEALDTYIIGLHAALAF
jgi:hypothetical protein